MEDKIQLLIDYFDNLNVENGLQFTINRHEILYSIFKKYNNEKTLRHTKPVYISSGIDYNESVIGVYFDYIDMDLMEWGNFVSTLRKYYPNLNSICIGECSESYDVTDCELILLLLSHNYEIKYTLNSKIKQFEHIYEKILYNKDFEISVNIIKVNNQIQVIIKNTFGV
jgi:hypothetical protein